MTICLLIAAFFALLAAASLAAWKKLDKQNQALQNDIFARIRENEELKIRVNAQVAAIEELNHQRIVCMQTHEVKRPNVVIRFFDSLFGDPAESAAGAVKLLGTVAVGSLL